MPSRHVDLTWPQRSTTQWLQTVNGQREKGVHKSPIPGRAALGAADAVQLGAAATLAATSPWAFAKVAATLEAPLPRFGAGSAVLPRAQLIGPAANSAKAARSLSKKARRCHERQPPPHCAMRRPTPAPTLLDRAPPTLAGHFEISTTTQAQFRSLG